MLLFTACEKEVDDSNEEEEITTLKYTLTPVGGGTATILSIRDFNGDNPIVIGGPLLPNQSYRGTLELLNENITPVEDVTVEVKEEDEDHQFFFDIKVAGVSITYQDQDADGNPIGLVTTLATGTAATGTLDISLRHLPIKSAAGVASGDPTNAGGEVEIEVTFPIDVVQ